MTLPADPGHTHEVHNGKRMLTLEELALMQPGMDRLMAEVGYRAHRLCYAGRAGNWRLADYYYKTMVKQLKLCSTSRPKYAAEMASYLDEDCLPVREAIRARDGAAFEVAFAQMVERANHYHGVFGKPWLVWVTPPTPPDDLDLTAGADS